METIVKRQSVQLVKETEVRFDSDKAKCTSPSEAVDVINQLTGAGHRPKEHFILLTLDTKMKAIGAHIVHVGSIDSSIVHPREVFQMAILDNASHIMVAHNHPSGELTPSDADIQVTRRLKEAGKVLGIELLDHFIIHEGHYLSLRERGYC